MAGLTHYLCELECYKHLTNIDWVNSGTDNHIQVTMSNAMTLNPNDMAAVSAFWNTEVANLTTQLTNYFTPNCTIPSSTSTLYISSRMLGAKHYELSNHLGNVLVTITDKKIAIPDLSNTIIEYYSAEISTISDYYPFGMMMPERSYTATTKGYRFGFNGKEQDNEVSGQGNTIAFEARIYDSRLGRFFSTDPLESDYAWQTPYAYYKNSPISVIDYQGRGSEEEKEGSKIPIIPSSSDRSQPDYSLGRYLRWWTKAVITGGTQGVRNGENRKGDRITIGYNNGETHPGTNKRKGGYARTIKDKSQYSPASITAQNIQTGGGSPGGSSTSPAAPDDPAGAGTVNSPLLLTTFNRMNWLLLNEQSYPGATPGFGTGLAQQTNGNINVNNGNPGGTLNGTMRINWVSTQPPPGGDNTFSNQFIVTRIAGAVGPPPVLNTGQVVGVGNVNVPVMSGQRYRVTVNPAANVMGRPGDMFWIWITVTFP